MLDRLLHIPEVPKTSALLFGPRGTGKTHWITHHLPHALIINLLKSETYTTLLANPSFIERFIPPGFTDWIVIDEVQKIPALLDEAHRLIEEKNYKFLLTGSSARKLKQQGANLLAGRARKHTMHPLTCFELKTRFSLEFALKNGLLPEVYISEDPKSYLHTYVQTYLQEEVLQEGLVRNIGEFARFLQIASFSQGEILNYAEIGRESGIKRKSVANYFDIAIDLLLGVTIPVFTKHAQRQLISHPKFYLFDVGVYRTLRPKGPLDSPESIEGHAKETLVLQHLRALNDYYQLGYDIYFWRTKAGLEIDFILYGERGLIAIEVKRKRKLSGNDLKALQNFSNDYPIAKLFCFYGGETALYHGKITVLPIENALRDLMQIISATEISTNEGEV